MALVLPPGVCNLQFFLGIPWCIVYDLCFGNIVEYLIYVHEINDAFDEVADLNTDVPEEIIYGPYTNDHDSL